MSANSKLVSMICCWCRRAEAATAEHRYRASLVRLVYSPDAFADPDRRPIRNVDGMGSQSARGPNADAFRYPKNLCAKCNNERSQPFDREFDRFAQFVHQNGESIRTIGILDFQTIFGPTWAVSVDLLLRAFAKEMACFIDESGYVVPERIRTLLDEGWSRCPAISLYFDLNPLVFLDPPCVTALGKSNASGTAKVSNPVEMSGLSYSFDFLSLRANLSFSTKLYNVDLVTPRKQHAFVMRAGLVPTYALPLIWVRDLLLRTPDRPKIVWSGGKKELDDATIQRHIKSFGVSKSLEDEHSSARGSS